MENKTCKDCDNFIGAGDWDLCCKNPPESLRGWCGHLCYEDTKACENFKPLRHIRLLNKETNWEPGENPPHTGAHGQ